MKRTDFFQLDRPMTFIPLHGETTVAVTTNGAYSQKIKAKSRPRESNITLAQVKGARLHISPGGNSITMTIHVPCEQASFGTFIDKATKVYEKYLRTN